MVHQGRAEIFALPPFRPFAGSQRRHLLCRQPKKCPHGFRRAGAQLDLPFLSINRYLPARLRNESRSGSRPSPTSRH